MLRQVVLSLETHATFVAYVRPVRVCAAVADGVRFQMIFILKPSVAILTLMRALGIVHLLVPHQACAAGECPIALIARKSSLSGLERMLRANMGVETAAGAVQLAALPAGKRQFTVERTAMLL